MYKPDPDSAAAHRPSQRFNRNKDFVTQDHEYYVRQKEFKNKRLSNLKDRFQRQEEHLSYLNSLDSKVSKKVYEIQGKNSNSVGYDLLNYRYQKNHQGKSQIGVDLKIDIRTNQR